MRELRRGRVQVGEKKGIKRKGKAQSFGDGGRKCAEEGQGR